MKEESKRRTLAIVLVMFVALLLTGIVYAAVTGTLDFFGTSRFGTNVDLVFVNESITGPESGDSVIVSNNGHTLTFNVLMTTPGTTRYIKFKVENVGNVAAELGELVITGPTASTGIVVTWPTLDGVVVEAGATSAEYTIEVYWDPAYPSVTADANFSATIDFAQTATTP